MFPLLIELFLIHAVYNRSEICYRDLINKPEIELLKEKLLNNPPPPSKRRKEVFVLTTRRPPFHEKGK